MEKALIVILVLLVTAFGLVYYAASQKMLDVMLEQGFSEVDTEAEFTARVDRALGLTASEDASDVLTEPTIDWELQDGLQRAEFKYKVFLSGENKVSDVRTKFYKSDFNSRFGVNAYYKEQEDWKQLLMTAKAGSAVVSEYVLAFDVIDYTGKTITAGDIKAMNDYAKKMARQLNMTITNTDSVEDTQQRAETVKTVFQKYLAFSFMKLRADWNKVYKGKEIHDAAMGLGLTLTEAGSYAWISSQTTNEDVFFRIFCGDEDKEFVPEKMVKDSFKVKNLLFVLMVPLVYDPEEAYVNMVKAAKYYQQRFGGQIVNLKDEVMKEEDFAKEQERIAQLADELEKMGIQPGSFRAYSIFD